MFSTISEASAQTTIFQGGDGTDCDANKLSISSSSNRSLSSIKCFYLTVFCPVSNLVLCLFLLVRYRAWFVTMVFWRRVCDHGLYFGDERM